MTLYFDSKCPLCSSFAKLLEKRLGTAIAILPLPENDPAPDFKIEGEDGKILFGKEAIFELEKQIPQVKNFFWMLPSSYRGQALYSTYALAKLFRRVFNFLTGKKCGGCF